MYVPPEGLDTWGTPDPALAPGQRLAGGLDVDVLEQRPDGWAHVRCSNGWEAWVDGRRLVTTPGKSSNKNTVYALVAAGVGAIVIVLALALGGGGDGDSGGGTDVAAGAGDDGGGDGSGPATGKGYDPESGEFDSAVVAAAIKKVDKGDVDSAGSDDVAAKSVADEMKAAGFDIGEAIVVPYNDGERMLYVSITDDSPLNQASDNSQDFITLLLNAKAIDAHGITRIMFDVVSSDDKGPYTATMTARVAEFRAAMASGADDAAAKAIQFQIERG